jgi:hypothetical protein
MSAPQNTAAEWAATAPTPTTDDAQEPSEPPADTDTETGDDLVDYVAEHKHCPLSWCPTATTNRTPKRVPVWLTSVDVHAGTCATMTDAGHVTYLTTTDDLRLYLSSKRGAP